MTYITCDSCAPARRPARRIGLFERLSILAAVTRQRRALARLDAHQLADLGLSPEAAQREANRPIWDVPANWRD